MIKDWTSKWPVYYDKWKQNAEFWILKSFKFASKILIRYHDYHHDNHHHDQQERSWYSWWCPWSAYKCLRNGQSLRREESPSRFCNNPTTSYRNSNNPSHTISILQQPNLTIYKFQQFQPPHNPGLAIIWRPVYKTSKLRTNSNQLMDCPRQC